MCIKYAIIVPEAWILSTVDWGLVVVIIHFGAALPSSDEVIPIPQREILASYPSTAGQVWCVIIEAVVWVRQGDYMLKKFLARHELETVSKK